MKSERDVERERDVDARCEIWEYGCVCIFVLCVCVLVCVCEQHAGVPYQLRSPRHFLCVSFVSSLFFPSPLLSFFLSFLFSFFICFFPSTLPLSDLNIIVLYFCLLCLLCLLFLPYLASFLSFVLLLLYFLPSFLPWFFTTLVFCILSRSNWTTGPFIRNKQDIDPSSTPPPSKKQSVPFIS